MKRILLFVLLCTSTSLFAQNSNVPDDNFENYLETHTSTGSSVSIGNANSMGDGAMNNVVPTSKINTVTTLKVQSINIANLTGIEDFSALETLWAYSNNLIDVDVSSNTVLQEVRLENNNLTNVITGNLPNLTWLGLHENNINTIDVSGLPVLETLYLRANNLSTIDVSNNPLLEVISLQNNNNITTLDFSNNPNLNSLSCSDNNISTLDISNNPLITWFWCSNNPIGSLDLRHMTSLNNLQCENAQLTYLNVRNDANGLMDSDFDFRTAGNPNLTCITVDDPAYSASTWINYVDNTSSFGEHCFETYVPDNNFENYLENTNKGNGVPQDDYVLTANISSVTGLNISSRSISDATGLEDFAALRFLKIQNNSLDELDISFNTNLEKLDCSSNNLDNISTNNNPSLRELIISGNNLMALDVSSNTNLEALYCSNNDLTSITYNNNPNLEELSCFNNFLSTFDVSNLPSLEQLSCTNNEFTTLDLSSNTALLQVYAYEGLLTSVTIGNNPSLDLLNIRDNAITSLDISTATALTRLLVENNNLSTLDVRNGNNSNFTSFTATGNPNLTCVNVDSVMYSDDNWINDVDGQVSFTESNACEMAIECASDVLVTTLAGNCDALINVTPPTVSSNGALSKTALNFDGVNDKVVVANGFDTELSEVTIEVKVNVDAFDSNSVLLNYSSWSSGFLHFQFSGNGQLGWSVNGNAPVDQFVNLGLQTNVWYNLAVSYSVTDKIARFYVDGILHSERTYTTALPLVANAEYVIGEWSNGRRLDGSIDDFRIWNTVRTEAEIQSTLNIPLSGNESNLVAYYNFNDGDACIDNTSVTTITDLAGTHNGTLSGFDLTNTSTCESNFIEGDTFNYILTNDYNNASILKETFPVGVTTVTWTAVNASDNTTVTCTQDITKTDNIACSVSIAAKVFLQGASLNPNTGEETLMRDDLRVANLIETTSPYTDVATCNATVFDTTGNNAIVDWIWVELRDAIDNTVVIDSQSALLQRDGDVVDLDGTSTLTFNIASGNYYVVIKHRNHLGIMTANALMLSGITTIVDFTNANSPITFGTNAQTTNGMPTNVVALWAGNVNGGNQMRYQGSDNDTNTIKDNVLADTGNTSSSNLYSFTDYDNADVNMDGTVKYQGSGNDSNTIKDIILSHPSNTSSSNLFTIEAQLPNN